jgi:hypothetical protein
MRTDGEQRMSGRASMPATRREWIGLAVIALPCAVAMLAAAMLVLRSLSDVGSERGGGPS